VLTPLLLRGPQTVNELRVRTERAHPFGGNDEVLATLDRLAGRDEPLVVHLPRQSGQKETRWMHLLGGEIDVDALAAAPPPVTTSARAGLEARVAELEDRVAALEELLRGRDPDHEREQSPS
jgi:uncharacterized protein